PITAPATTKPTPGTAGRGCSRISRPMGLADSGEPGPAGRDPPVSHHILGSASNLLGITLLILARLHITGATARAVADAGAWVGAIGFSLSCTLSYLSIRSNSQNVRAERMADAVFMGGLLSLIVAVVVLALSRAI